MTSLPSLPSANSSHSALPPCVGPRTMSCGLEETPDRALANPSWYSSASLLGVRRLGTSSPSGSSFASPEELPPNRAPRWHICLLPTCWRAQLAERLLRIHIKEAILLQGGPVVGGQELQLWSQTTPSGSPAQLFDLGQTVSPLEASVCSSVGGGNRMARSSQ